LACIWGSPGDASGRPLPFRFSSLRRLQAVGIAGTLAALGGTAIAIDSCRVDAMVVRSGHRSHHPASGGRMYTLSAHHVLSALGANVQVAGKPTCHRLRHNLPSRLAVRWRARVLDDEPSEELLQNPRFAVGVAHASAPDGLVRYANAGKQPGVLPTLKRVSTQKHDRLRLLSILWIAKCEKRALGRLWRGARRAGKLVQRAFGWAKTIAGLLQGQVPLRHAMIGVWLSAIPRLARSV